MIVRDYISSQWRWTNSRIFTWTENVDWNRNLSKLGKNINMTSASLSAPAASSELALTTIIPTFTTDSPQGESPEFKTLKVFLYCTILAFSSLGNGLVFLLISCNRRLRQGSSNRLLLNLSACDFLTPLLGIPFDLVLEERGYVWPYGEFMCHALWPASTFTATASALTLAAISLDRQVINLLQLTPQLTYY